MNRQNLAMASLLAAILTPFAEKHWNVKVDADTVIDAAAVAATGWHFLASSLIPLKPYADRIFNRYFPPQPATGDKHD